MKKLLSIAAALAIGATLSPLAGAHGDNPHDDLVYVAVEPCRIADTRISSEGAIRANTSRDFRVYGSAADLAAQGGKRDCPNPKDNGLKPVAVAAYFVAVPAESSTGAGILAAYPSNQTQPPAGTGATLNFTRGQVLGNTSIATLCNANEQSCPDDSPLAVMSRDTDEHVVIDVQGYFFPQSSLPGYQIVERTTAVANTRSLSVGVECPTGKKVIGGGGAVGDSSWFMDSSYPLSNGTGWQVHFSSSGQTFSATGTARAVCVSAD